MCEEHRKYAEPRVFWINCKYSLVKINDYRNVQSDKAERARTTILFYKKNCQNNPEWYCNFLFLKCSLKYRIKNILTFSIFQKGYLNQNFGEQNVNINLESLPEYVLQLNVLLLNGIHLQFWAKSLGN